MKLFGVIAALNLPRRMVLNGEIGFKYSALDLPASHRAGTTFILSEPDQAGQN